MAGQDMQDKKPFIPTFSSGNFEADAKLDEALKQVDEAELAKLINEVLGSEVNKLQTFMDLAQNLRAKQDELDSMAVDTLPAAILTAYLSDVLEPNNNGDLISISAKTPGEQSIVDTIYKELSIPPEKVVYSLLKNGIAIGEFSREKVDSKSEKAANEAVAEEDIKVAVNYGRVLPEISIIQDTTTVFPIIKKEKCIGYIEVTKTEVVNDFDWTTDSLTYNDVIIHDKSDYAYVKFGVNKSSRPLQLKIKNKNGQVDVYDIDVGCSLLENSYSAWKTLSILQDSIVLASLIKNATTIIIQTEAGEMSDAQIQQAKVKLKSLFEGKLALGKNGLKSYLSPQSKPNYVYSFTSGGVGTITTETVGGEYNPGQLYYMEPFINQFFGGMNAPKQQFGFTGDGAGLDGGGAVEEYTKRYTSTVSLFKRLLADFIKACINNVLTSRGLLNLVNNFDVKIYKAYKEEDQGIVQMQQQNLQVMQDVFNFLELEDPIQIRNVKIAMMKKIFSDKVLIETFEAALMAKTPDPEEKPAEVEETEETEEDGNVDESNDVLSEIDNFGSSSEETPSENTGEDEEMPELPPMSGQIPPEELE